jgi:hypothetical protein
MKDHVITAASLPSFMHEIQGELESNPVLLVTTKGQRTGKWGMARLWYSWMATTADFMAARGVTLDIKNSAGDVIETLPFDQDAAHELFTKKWLGVGEDGKRLSWSRSGREGMRAATKGERYDALRQHEAWAIDKGIDLFHPRDSEYRELRVAQDA